MRACLLIPMSLASTFFWLVSPFWTLECFYVHYGFPGDEHTRQYCEGNPTVLGGVILAAWALAFIVWATVYCTTEAKKYRERFDHTGAKTLSDDERASLSLWPTARAGELKTDADVLHAIRWCALRRIAEYSDADLDRLNVWLGDGALRVMIHNDKDVQHALMIMQREEDRH